MQPYANLGGNSNVTSYENGEGYIIVQFATGYWKNYTYTYASAGSSIILRMQRLADSGQGLNSYIRREDPKYSNKC